MLQTRVVGRRLPLVALTVVIAVTSFPPAAWAQQASGIAGVVRDTSGAVIPGVTVEAASPALIEKVRTVVSDGAGRYNVEELRPGTYSVTFSLTGFNTVKREGIELTSGFTATVNADMKVGALEETVTVTGASPLVDTQNVKQGKVISDELLAALPSGSKGFSSLARLIPGMSGGADSGGANGIYTANATHTINLHGKGATKVLYDGMQTQNLCGTGCTSYITNPATVEETTIETGGISAESNSGGISINLIPKEGGNLFKFGASGTFTNQHFQGDNLSDALRARGVATGNTVLHLYDANFTVGGPIKQDRVWFFAATRFSGTKNHVAGIFFNKTRGTPFYTPDLSQPAFRREWLKSQAQRITWQISPKNKLSGFADVESFQVRGTGGLNTPEAQQSWSFWPDGVYQATWNAPVTGKFLLEAGASLAKNGYPFTQTSSTDIFGFDVKTTDVSILEASTGLRYNAFQMYNYKNDQDRYAERFAASYITGTHSFKAGIQIQQGVANKLEDVNANQRWTFNRGVPTTIEQWATPFLQQTRFKWDLGLFAQDKWAFKRLTLTYGLRFDYFNGYVPAQHEDAGQFMAARDFAPVKDVPNWSDLDPRMGASYDLFGTGKTALKASFGRYVGKVGTAVALALHPVTASVNNATRSWADANGNYIPDCDLKNLAVNGECGAISNVNFGKSDPNAITYADDLIHGFGTRDYIWDFTTELTHELGSRMSMTGGYYRSWSNHFGSIAQGWPTGVTNNLAVTPADYSTYCITAPVDARLPGGGGYQVCGLYDVAPAKFGQGALRVERASSFGGKRRASDFFTVSFSTRFGGGRDFGGSVDTGRVVEDNCYVVDSPQQLLDCRVVQPFKALTQIKLYGSYPLPGGLVFSGVYQNVSGITYNANYAVSTNAIRPSLGRHLAACGTRVVCTSTATVPLVAPQTLFEPRRNMLDLRASKIFVLGKTRLRANLDLYNVLNNGSILAINNTYGANWLLPGGQSSIMNARILHFGGEFSF